MLSLGVTSLCTNWALVADILMYVIVPNKRATAQSIQILASHLLGDATSPVIIGAVSLITIFHTYFELKILFHYKILSYLGDLEAGV